jgi:hypothetical protein
MTALKASNAALPIMPEPAMTKGFLIEKPRKTPGKDFKAPGAAMMSKPNSNRHILKP